MPTRNCRQCGGEIPNSTDTCPHCGALDQAIAILATQQMTNPSTSSETGNSGLPANTSSSVIPRVQHSAKIQRIIELSEKARTLLYRCIAVTAGILIVVAFVITRPVADPPLLPAGVASMIEPDGTIPGTATVPGTPPSIIGSGANTALLPQNTVATPADTNYLSFLQKIDLQRMGLTIGFNSALNSSIQGPESPPTQDYGQNGQDLLRDFVAQKAPPDCTALSNTYFTLVQDEAGLLQKSVSSWQSGDIKTAAADRDAAVNSLTLDAQNADTALTQICASWHIDKPFAVQAGITSTPTPAPPGDTSTPTTTTPESAPGQTASPTAPTSPAAPTTNH